MTRQQKLRTACDLKHACYEPRVVEKQLNRMLKNIGASREVVELVGTTGFGDIQRQLAEAHKLLASGGHSINWTRSLLEIRAARPLYYYFQNVFENGGEIDSSLWNSNGSSLGMAVDFNALSSLYDGTPWAKPIPAATTLTRKAAVPHIWSTNPRGGARLTSQQLCRLPLDQFSSHWVANPLFSQVCSAQWLAGLGARAGHGPATDQKFSVRDISTPMGDAFLAGCYRLFWTEETLYWLRRPKYRFITINGESRNAVQLETELGTFSQVEGFYVPNTFLDNDGKLELYHIADAMQEEIRRMMCEQYGWERYLVDAQCQRLDRRFNDRDGQWESLYQLPDATRRLCVVDPSTGRKYCLGVPNETENCQAAQEWMTYGLDRLGIHRS